MRIQNSERRAIANALKNKKSLRVIAKRLGRSVRSVGDEIRRNSVKGVYDPWKADRKACLRRKQSKQRCLKVAVDPALKKHMTDHVGGDQNPEAVSARLKHVDTHLPYTSTEAIYAFVHSVHGGNIERRLYTKRVKRHGGRKRGSASPGDAHKKRITDRPRRIENRTEFGHFEGDFIESGKDGVGSILVLVERMTRYPFMVYTETKDTLTINAPLATTLADVSVQSITLDNDVSFQKHEELSELIHAAVYFTHPCSSQEKGTVENRNKALREYIPTRSNISACQHVTEYAQEKLRNRFMVVLNGLSPQEAWDTHMKTRHGA